MSQSQLAYTKRTARKSLEQIEKALKLLLDEGFTANIYSMANGEIVRLEPPKQKSKLSPLARSAGIFSLTYSQLQWILQRGLARREGKILVALPEARAYLRRNVELPVQEYAYARQHHDIKPAAQLPNTELRLSQQERELLAQNTMVNRDENPLACLAKRRKKSGAAWLESYHIEAGERLRADFTFGQMMPSTTTNWSLSALAGANTNTNRNSTQNLQDGALAARQRFQQAMTAVGSDFSGLLVDVCCFLKGLEIVERERQWPARSAKLVLKLALNALAVHYGLKPVLRPYTRSVPVMHWGTEDYRPSME